MDVANIELGVALNFAIFSVLRTSDKTLDEAAAV